MALSRYTLAALVLCAVLVFLAFTTWGGTRKQDSRAYYFSIRSQVLRARAEDAEAGSALLIGDSITEMSPLITLCGRPVFNAGISGSGVEEWTRLAPELIRTLRPSLVVVALGVNDTQRAEPFDAGQWAEHYHQLLSSYRGPRILLAPLPVEAGKRYGTDYYDPARIEELRRIVIREGGIAIPLVPTSDGVHPSQAGRLVWAAGLADACP